VSAEPDPRAWRGRRVAVTGGEGFLGGALLAQLRALGADAWAVRHAEHDLRTAEGTRAAVDEAEVVFHLAARVGGIGFNLRHPAVLAHDNLLLGAHVFEQSRLAGVQRLVAVSSVCAYPVAPPVPFSEESLWDGYPEPSNAAYGVSKRMLVTLSEAYWRQHGFWSCTPVLTNLYGPGDHDDPEDSHVIPALVRRFVEARDDRAERVVVWGTGRPTRDFLYVDDAARALLLAGERLDRPLTFNVASGEETAIADVVRIVSDAVGFEGDVAWDAARPDGQLTRRIDVSRARSALAFEPRVALEEGLRRTVAAFLASPAT
jgi:GDP-L-fucose synthase